jgi:hypothetical protein
MTSDRDLSAETPAARGGRRAAWSGAAAALLAGFLLAPEPAPAQMIRFRIGGGRTAVAAAGTAQEKKTEVAAALALEVGRVQQRFEQGRRGLSAVTGPDGRRLHLRRDVAALIDRTGEDLEGAITRVPEPGLAGLQAWAAEEIGRIRRACDGPPAERTSRGDGGFGAPRAVAVIAGAGGLAGRWLPLPGAAARAAAKDPGTVEAGAAGALLDQVAGVLGRIFFLAEKDDLEVKLWVGSTPTPEATFRFWSQGRLADAPPAPHIVRTNGRRERVLRGLYAYKAALGTGPVTRFLEYPPRPGAPEAQLTSERLDLVNGSSFFCCRFAESYCHHVDDEKECRGGRR